MPVQNNSQGQLDDPVGGFNQRTLDCLACPVCYGKLAVAVRGIACTGCQRVYPLVDGIPVLIGERAAFQTWAEETP
jgi:uncharacterized protein YbaR (Trm112 family)